MKIAHISLAHDVVKGDAGARDQIIYLLANKQQSEGCEVVRAADPFMHCYFHPFLMNHSVIL